MAEGYNMILLDFEDVVMYFAKYTTFLWRLRFWTTKH